MMIIEILLSVIVVGGGIGFYLLRKHLLKHIDTSIDKVCLNIAALEQNIVTSMYDNNTTMIAHHSNTINHVTSTSDNLKDEYQQFYLRFMEHHPNNVYLGDKRKANT